MYTTPCPDAFFRLSNLTWNHCVLREVSRRPLPPVAALCNINPPHWTRRGQALLIFSSNCWWLPSLKKTNFSCQAQLWSRHSLYLMKVMWMNISMVYNKTHESRCPLWRNNQHVSFFYVLYYISLLTEEKGF